MSIKKSTFAIIFFMLFAGITTSYFMYQKNEQPQAEATSPVIVQSLLPLTQAPAQISTPSFTETPSITTIPVRSGQTTATASQPSPDGAYEIISQTQTNPDTTKMYSFSVSHIPNPNQQSQHIFSKTVDSNSSISIPFNTFSPDDKYIFLQDMENSTTNFLVFNVSGQPFANGQQYIDVSHLFKQYTSSYALYAVTGWASNTLLIIETTGNNAPSTSFWFDVTNQSFTPLATRF